MVWRGGGGGGGGRGGGGGGGGGGVPVVPHLTYHTPTVHVAVLGPREHLHQHWRNLHIHREREERESVCSFGDHMTHLLVV